MMEEARKRAKDSEHQYATERFVVIGDDELFKKFQNEFGVAMPYWYGNASELKNNSKVAEVATGYFGEFYVDGRDMHEGFDRLYQNRIVIIDGEYLVTTFHRNSPATFSILGDFRDYYHKLPYRWEEHNPEPNKCSVLTDKKIQAWLDWLRLRRETYEGIIRSENQEVEAFLSRINDVRIPGCVKKCTDKSGTIVKNNIRFSYNINDGHVIQKIDIDNSYGDDRLGDFLKMAVGKYD